MLGYLKEKISGAVTKVSAAVRDRFSGGAVKRTLDDEDQNSEEGGYAAEAISPPKRARREGLGNHATDLNGLYSGHRTGFAQTSYNQASTSSTEWAAIPVLSFGASLGRREQTIQNDNQNKTGHGLTSVQFSWQCAGGIPQPAEVAAAGNPVTSQAAVTSEPGASTLPDHTGTNNLVDSYDSQFSRRPTSELSQSAGTSLKTLGGLRSTNLRGTMNYSNIPNLDASLNSTRSSVNKSTVSYRPIHDKLFFPGFTPRTRNGSPRSSPASAGSSTLNSTIRKCIRMDQKEQYSKLLEQFQRQRVFSSSLASPPAERERPPAKAVQIPVVDLENESVSRKDTSESLSSPKIVINTLEEALAKSPLFSRDYIVSLRQRFSAAERERQRVLDEERIRARVLTEYREKFERAVEERFRKQVILVPPALLEEEEAAVVLPEITGEMEIVIRNTLKSGPSKVCEIYDIAITKQDLATLCGLNWLNDQIINCYFTMIMERSKQGKFPSVYSCNTFFYPKLMQSGHSSLKRWTRKVDIFAHDFVLVPVHLGIHWCAAVIAIKEKSIRYYDSMNGDNQAGLKALLQYLQDESLDKKKTKLDVSGWKLECVKNVPQQMNGSDCGVFACKFAEYASRKARFTFTQEDMPYFRKRMIYEIVTKKLIHP